MLFPRGQIIKNTEKNELERQFLQHAWFHFLCRFSRKH